MHTRALMQWVRRLMVGGLAAALVLAGPLTASAPRAAAAPAAPGAVAWTATRVGQYGGAVSSVAINGPLAYVGRGPRLQIYDVAFSNPPDLLGQSAVLPALVEDVAFAGDYAYVALGVEDVWVLDVSDWDNIAAVAELPTASQATNVVVANGHAYVGAGTYLYIYSLADPGGPVQTASLNTSVWIENLAVSGNMAYLVYDTFDATGLKLVDVSNPAAPTVVKTVEVAGEAVDVAVQAGYAYVASDGPGLEVIDVEPPTSASVVGATNLSISVGSVAVLGNYAYVGEWAGGAVVINVTNPLSPAQAGYLGTRGRTLKLQVVGTRLFMANDGAGLAAVSVSTPANPTLLAATPGDTVLDVSVGQTFGGQAAVLANYEAGVTTIDVNNPAAPTWLDTFEGLAFFGVVKLGATAYAAEASAGLRVLQVAVPDNVTSLGTVFTDGFAADVAVKDGYAYVANFNDGLFIADLDPLGEAGSLDTPGTAASVAVSGTHAYVAAGTADLQVIDVSNPVSPTLVTTVTFSGNGFGVTVRGNYAYVAAFGGGLVVVDVSDPQAPSVVGQLDAPGSAAGVALHGNLALLASQGVGVVAVDVSNPAQPAFAGQYRTNDPQAVFASGDYVYVADGAGGLVILQQQTSQQLYLPLVRR